MINDNEKVTFDELIKSGEAPYEPEKPRQDVFTDTPQRHNYTLLILSVIAIICAFLFGFYYRSLFYPPEKATAVFYENGSRSSSSTSVSDTASLSDTTSFVSDSSKLAKHPEEAATAPSDSDPVNINTANAETLKTI